MRQKVIESCQNCGVKLQSQREVNAWLCYDCLEEGPADEDPRDVAFREPDCEQCGGPAQDGFCRVCQA